MSLTRRMVAVVTVVAFAAPGCGKKKGGTPATGSSATHGSGSGSGSDGTGGGTTTAGGGTDSLPAMPADPAQTSAVAASEEVMKLLDPTVGAGDKFGKIIDIVAQGMKTMPRDWDPALVVSTVGKDPAALLHWVRDQTALVPYRGSLRGAVGVMMDRVGNSLDRALLLAELAKQAGLEARLANATLADDAVQKLDGSWAKRARPAIPQPKVDDDGLLARVLKELGGDAAAITAAQQKALAADKALEDKTRARIAEQTTALAGLVPAAGTPASHDPSVLGDHWWVQIESGGAWQDLDPSLPDAEPGQTLAAATTTVEPNQLPDDQRHTMTVRVVGEVWADQTRQETPLVELTFAPARYFGQRISVTNIPIDVPPQADTVGAAKDRMAAAKAAILTESEWIPVIRIGEHVTAKMSVTDGGELFDVSAPDANTTRLARAVSGATKKAVGGATGMLDTLPGDEPATPDVAAPPPIAPHSGFTAQWIEIETRIPGGASRVARRTVFDVLDAAGDRAAARPAKLSDDQRFDRGLALGAETEILPVFARIPDGFVADRTIKALVAAKPVLAELAALGDKPPSPALRQRVGQLAPVPGPLYQLERLRMLWSNVGDRVYLDELTVLTMRQRLVATGAALAARTEFDIVANRVGVWPGHDGRTTRIAQGVADTAVESAVLACTPETKCTRSANTSELFAQTAGKGWTTVGTGSAALPGGAEGRRLASADLAAGYVVVSAPGGSGVWWRVDPSTGETLGMTARGGNTSTETAIVDNMILCAAGLMKCIWQFETGTGDIDERANRGAICAGASLLGLAGASIVALTGGLRVLGLLMQVGATWVG